MDLLTVIILILLAASLSLTVWLLVSLHRTKRLPDDKNFESVLQLLKAELINNQTESLLTLRDSLDNANRLLNERLAEGNRNLDERMAFIGEIENKLGQLAVQTKNIESIGKNIQSLSQLLRPPKVRGGLGEMLLENLLREILPAGLYETQYKFAGGQRVDAIIKIGDRLLPVDAKFPLESYERVLETPDNENARKEFTRSLKKHIDDISQKYLRPDEKTLDFAVMFIPSEGVYYQFISQKDENGLEYALSRKIVPSSPGHLYAFLASVSSLYAALGLNENGLAGSRRLLNRINDLKETLGGIRKLLERMEGSLRALSLNFEKVRSESVRMQTQLDRLQEPQETNRETVDD
ncbi:MAG: DNA recombination protein RmuC [Candidatus Zixiibacteriota bacterium]